VARPLTGTAPLPDTGDLLLVAAGDAAAERRLLDRWRRPVYTVLERMLDPTPAADAAAAVFEALFRSAPRFDPKTSFPARLWGLVAKEASRPPSAGVPAIPAVRLRESAAAQIAIQRAAIAALPPADRAAFLLARVARQPLPVVAEALGTSEGELRRRLVRAFESLAGSLQPLLNPEAVGLAATEGRDALPARDEAEP
jgi:DNA-directed RNA polymerase specialized sigma24 family protein